MTLPLRLRLTATFAVGMAVVLAGLGSFVYWRVGRDLLASTDLSLRARAQAIVEAVDRGDVPVAPRASNLIDADESFAQVVTGSGDVLETSSSRLGTSLVPPDILPSVTTARFRTERIPRIDADPVRLLVVPLGPTDHRFVVVGATLGDRRDALERLLVALAVGGPVALLVTSLAGWLVAGAALRPVEAMRDEAASISVSEPHRRLPVPETGDELARLGATLNSMLDRLQAAYDRERRFVDDASHELRTPLAVLKMELDLALARSRTVEELEAAVRSASVETDRLVRLAEDLLVLARAEHGTLPIRRAEVPLAALLDGPVTGYRARARSAGVRIVVEAGPETAMIDPARVRQAVENLLENALRHSPRDGVILIRAGRDEDAVTIDVQDAGPGFPEELLDRAFEPFARAGSTRADGSGAGLGLSIVRTVMEAHGGSARAENVARGGARIVLTLPAGDQGDAPLP